MKITIGKSTYEIVFVDRLFEFKPDDKKLVGETDLVNKEIKILKGSKDIETTLFHEITHAIFYEFKELKHLKNNEELVEEIAKILVHTHQAGQRVGGSSKTLQKRPCTRKGSSIKA